MKESREDTDRVGIRALRQSTAIVMVALALGLTVNAVRPDGLSLATRWSPEAQLRTSDRGENFAVSLEEATDLFLADEALFIDARDETAFEEGHIEGAINLPWHDFEARFTDVMPQLTSSSRIIAYCDGDSCGLSKELAVTLLAKGYDNVKVLVDGWSKWQGAGLPVSK